MLQKYHSFHAGHILLICCIYQSHLKDRALKILSVIKPVHGTKKGWGLHCARGAKCPVLCFNATVEREKEGCSFLYGETWSNRHRSIREKKTWSKAMSGALLVPRERRRLFHTLNLSLTHSLPAARLEHVTVRNIQ